MPRGATPADVVGASLLAKGFEIIKQYPGPEQVELAVVINIPGSWFGAGAQGGLTASEKKDKYEAVAVEFAPVHEFPRTNTNKKGSKEPAIRFICPSDAEDEPNHEGFWIPLAQWNRYRHDTYKDRREDELPFIKDQSDNSITLGGDTAASTAEAQNAAILKHFELVNTGTHMQKSKKTGQLVEVQCSWYRCIQTGCRRSASDLIREVGKGTGQLFRELKKCNPTLHRELRMVSRHSKLVRGEDGEEVELMPFKEALIHHVRFVKWCIADWQPFARCRSKALQGYLRSLNPRAGLPHRNTCVKILGLLRNLSDIRLKRMISSHAAKFKEPFAGSTSDIWSTRSCRESYFCMRVSLVLEPDTIWSISKSQMRPPGLIEVSPMIAFQVFKNTTHSAPVIKRYKVSALRDYAMTPSSLCLMTEDGASNNKKSAKLMRAAFKVCVPHDLQRSILFAAGIAGSTSLNSDLKAFINAASRMAAAPHRSTKTSFRLQKAQVDEGTRKSRALVTETKNTTRWTGLYRMARKNRILEKPLTLALTGSDTGVATEDPADPVSSDSDREDKVTADSSDDEGEASCCTSSDDEVAIAANQAASKEFPLAHRLLDQRGFKNNALLQSVLHHPHEVCLLLQKAEGVGLSTAWQLLRVLHDGCKQSKLMVVSGTSAEGVWKDFHEGTLPEMFKKFRSILSEQLESRFHVHSTPDKYTLLALAMDPTVNTSSEDGIFKSASAAQALMEAEYRRALRKRAPQKGSSSDSTPSNQGSSSLADGAEAAQVNRQNPSTISKTAEKPKEGSGKRPASVLSLMAGPTAKKNSTVHLGRESTDADLEKEVDTFATISGALQAEGVSSRFYVKGMFSHSDFWLHHRSILPIHYKVFITQVGCAKAASANVETVFSGVGGMLAKAASMGSDLVADYAICHHNFKYPWLCPDDADVVKAYTAMYGKDAHISDASESESEDECGSDDASSDTSLV